MTRSILLRALMLTGACMSASFAQAQSEGYFKGKPSGPNPWNATTLEWQTSETPPIHGNFGAELPKVYRWAYDFSVPGVVADFIPQNMAPQDVQRS